MRVFPVVLVFLLAAVVTDGAQPLLEAVRHKEAGNTYLKQRQYAAARDQYLAALRLDPGYADVHYNLGVVYFFRLEDYPRALYHFVRYVDEHPDASDAGQVRDLITQALEKIEAGEREAYAEALRRGTTQDLEAFRRTHPQSPYAADAVQKVAQLAAFDKEVSRRDQATRAAFEQAVVQATPEAMNRFLADYPAAAQTAEATRLRDLWAAQRAADEEAFLAAVNQGTSAALAAFLEERPQSAYAPEAQKRLQQLRAAAEAYRIAAAARSAPALEQFLVSYGSSAQAAEARALLAELRAEQGATAAQAVADRAWEQAVHTNTVAAYQAWLAEYPAHERTVEARERVAALEQQAEADRLWQAVTDENRATTYRDFAVAYPEHAQAGEAQQRALALEALAAGELAWDRASRENTAAAYRQFLAEHPDHSNADAARLAVARVEAEAVAAADRAARQAADQAWKEAERTGTIAAYEAFLAAHPEHSRAARAQREIVKLQGEAAAARGDAAWQVAEQAGTAAAYRDFLAAYPGHRQVGKAQRNLDKLEQQAADAAATAVRQAADQAWQVAETADTAVAYQTFLAAHPNHAKAGQARQRLSALEEAAASAAAAEAARTAADRAWAAAEATDAAPGYEAFTHSWPDHPRAGEARRRAAAMAAVIPARPAVVVPAPAQPPTDPATTAWGVARDTDTVDAYEAFLQTYPEAEEAAAARNRLAELREAARPESPDSELSRSRRKALGRYRRMLTDE